MLYGGNKQLQMLDALVLSGLSGALEEDGRIALQAQIARLELIQRSPGGRIVSLFVDPDAQVPSLRVGATSHCLARIKLEGGGRFLLAAVFTHGGRIRSIEYHGNPERVMSTGTVPSVVSVEIGVEDRGVGPAITRLEHGRDEG
jgi:hypothetical protein